jgi:[ribosomal protein S5]-alanine N-acetyltransferase
VKIPALESDRLRLRAFRESDLEAYAAMSADQEVMQFIGTGVTLTRAETWRSIAFFLGHWEIRGYGMWALERKEDGALVGRAGFHDPEGWPDFELGWLLAREHWGRGYAREAARVALHYARETLGRKRVVSLIRPGNLRSISVATALGETLAGEMEFLGGPMLLYECVAA